METAKTTVRTVEIESAYYLMQVYNAINEDRTSMVFVYNGIKFWREDYVFMVERDEQASAIGEVFDFEEFRKLLLRFEPENQVDSLY